MCWEDVRIWAHWNHSFNMHLSYPGPVFCVCWSVCFSHPELPWGSLEGVECSLMAVQFSSVTQSHLTLCDLMDCSTSGLPVHHQFPEFTQTHVHWVSDAIQPSHSLLSPSPPTFNLSQHQGLFKWVSSSHQVAKVLSFSFNISPSNEHPGLISFRMDWLDLLASLHWRAAVTESLMILTSLFIDMTGNTSFFTEIKIVIKHYFIKFRNLKATWAVRYMC